MVARYVEEQTKSVGANLGAITVLVRRPEPPNRRAQAIIILPGTQFSPARQVPLAELHAPSDRLPRDPTLTRALALKERAAGPYHACSRQGTHKCQFFDQPADMTGATTESSTHAEARESFDDGAS